MKEVKLQFLIIAVKSSVHVHLEWDAMNVFSICLMKPSYIILTPTQQSAKATDRHPLEDAIFNT